MAHSRYANSRNDAVNRGSMQISKRLVGMHPDKVLGALQQHIDAGHEKSALQAIPDLQLQHPQFHNELEQTKARLSARLIEGVKVLDRNAAEVFRCVNCGGGLARQNPESKHVICQYCGCDAVHLAQNIHLERWNKAIDLEANFTIGDFFVFAGQRWQAIGVQLFAGRVKEYDEGEWETNFRRYTSWWMLNEQREIAWLIDGGGTRYWAEKYIPEKPSLPSTSDKKYEHGNWKLQFAAGEFSYQPKLGESLLSAEQKQRVSMPIRPGSNNFHRYYVSSETRLNANGEPKEVEFFRSRKIPDDEILLALGKSTESLDMNRWKHSIVGLLSALPLLLGLHFYLNQGGEEISNSVDLHATSADVQVLDITVAESGTMVEMNAVVSQLNVNKWLGVNFWLENVEGEAVYAKYLEFWRETGVDSDGRWDESKRGFTWHVRVDEPDTYKARVSVEQGSTQTSSVFEIKAETNRTPMKPFIVAAILSFLLVMLCRSKIKAVVSVAASIAVNLKSRFDPAGKPKRQDHEEMQ